MRSLSRFLSLAFGVVLVWGASALAVRVPGKPAKAGCYAVFDVEGGSASGTKVTCSDCDASCDIGGPAGQADDQCVFMVRYCLNDTAAAPSCKAAGLKKVRSHLLPPGSLKFPTTASDTGCSQETAIPVKLKKKGKKKNTRVVTLVAQGVKGTKPGTERGMLVLVCTPHPSGTACPTTTTTTTTSTTTTTIFSCAPASPVDCVAGGNTFTKVMFTQGTGTTFCGGAGVFPHCITGEPGTDGKGGCTSNSDCKAVCLNGACTSDGSACTSDSTCTGNGTCGGGPSPQPPFSGCVGTGPNVRSDCTGPDAITPLGESCLYLGGGNATFTPPSLNPDGSTLELAAVCCSDDPATTHLLGTGTDPKTCTKGAGPGRHCANAPGTPCTMDNDCGQGGYCAPDANCFFGPPLPISSKNTSTCVLNVIAQDASGILKTADGSTTATYPLSSRVFLTGNDAAPCPQCISNMCDPNWRDTLGNPGQNSGQPCTPVGSEKTTLDCLPALSDFVGPIPVTLKDVTTGASTATADQNGLFCASVDPKMQEVPGAFGSFQARFIAETGAPAGALLDLNTPHPSRLASTFCIPASGNAIIDGAAGLPGPGATSLPGTVELVP